MGGTPPATAVPNAFVSRLTQLVPLSADELAVLHELQSSPRTVQRHRDIITEGRSYGSLFIIMEGNAIRYRILHDGRRQIVNIVLPGDIVGALGYFTESSLYSTKALTEVVIATIPFARLNTLNETHPRLVTKIFWWFSCESTIYAEHLVDLGRRSALERVAHFLLELLTRLQAVGLADAQSFKIPLTQELLADALGLSIPHVNRVLRRLREDNLVVVEDQRVTVKDIDSLSELADFDPGYLSRFPGGELLGG
ncbi:MAG TPA: Crp/Fnr family transcriptional regulator [Stellaceae bacterium]|jgi:CRP-like cAMP-binding protein|nr:Crp/Fnr family transcriptional regulator [Stellaceae bacterium]